jgi:hypothetical protein
MAKKLLVVTDFSIESLNILRLALNNTLEKQVDVVLMYAETPTDSISELLFQSNQKRINELMTPDFSEALAILKNRFESTIRSLRFEIFSGYSVNALRNFIEGNRIDTIYLPKNYSLQPAKNGFDPIPLIKKSKLPYQELIWDPNILKSVDETLDRLFELEPAMN